MTLKPCCCSSMLNRWGGTICTWKAEAKLTILLDNDGAGGKCHLSRYWTRCFHFFIFYLLNQIRGMNANKGLSINKRLVQSFQFADSFQDLHCSFATEFTKSCLKLIWPTSDCPYLSFWLWSKWICTTHFLSSLLKERPLSTKILNDTEVNFSWITAAAQCYWVISSRAIFRMNFYELGIWEVCSVNARNVWSRRPGAAAWRKHAECKTKNWEVYFYKRGRTHINPL